VERSLRIYSDFDGTIASCDVTDLVLQKLAPPEWESIERLWLMGSIDAATCMRRQIRLLPADYKALDEVLSQVELDPGFVDFAALCATNNWEIVVVSDGVDYFVRSVLTRYGFGHLPVFVNKLAVKGDRFELEQPWRRVECTAGSGVCKCAAVAERDPSANIYIGDGRSDECVGPKADVLYAKAKLADFCLVRNIQFARFTTFADVQQDLVERFAVREKQECVEIARLIGVVDE